MKIKTFRFNILSSCTDNDMHMKKQNMHDEYEALYSEYKIDNEINNFIKDKEVIDIKINEIYKSNTENNGTNKVMLQYTVMYNDKEVSEENLED